MAVAVDTVWPGVTGISSGGSPLTWTHTASGINRAVVVGVSQNNGAYTPGEVTVTYGGSSMTFLGAKASNNGTAGVAWLFGLVNPPTGPQTVSVQRSAGSYGFIGGSISFTGVDQTTPFGTAVTAAGDNSGGANPPSASVSSAAGNMVVDILAYGNTISNPTGTQQWKDNVSSSTAANNAAQSTYAGASSVTVGYNPAVYDWWGLVAVSINAASGSTSWVNRSVLQGDSVAQNGTNSHTCTFLPATAGNLLVAVVSGAVTFTTPTGWTLLQSAITSTATYVFTKTASSGDSYFITTHNGTNYPILGVVYEFPSTSSIVGTAGSATNQGQTGAGPICTGLTGVYTRFAVRSWGLGATSTTANATWTAPTVEDYDAYNASGPGTGISQTIAYDDNCASPAFTPLSFYSIVGTSAASSADVSFAVSTPGATPMPLFVQAQGTASGATSGTVQTSAFDWPVTAGDLLVVAVGYLSISITPTITDSLGNTYIKAAGPLDQSSLPYRDYIYYTVSGASGSNTVTLTTSGSITFRRLLIHEYANLDTQDGVNGATGGSGTIDSGSITTNFPVELIFGWGVSNNGTTSAGTGFTLRKTAGVESTEDKIVTSIGSYNATYPADGSAWLCQVVSFYSSVSPQTGTPLPWLHF